MTRLWISVLALGLFVAAVPQTPLDAQIPVMGRQIGRGYYNGYGRGYYGGYGRGYYRGYAPAYNVYGPGYGLGYGSGYSAGNNGYSTFGVGPYGYGNMGFSGQPYQSAFTPSGYGAYQPFTYGW